MRAACAKQFRDASRSRAARRQGHRPNGTPGNIGDPGHVEPARRYAAPGTSMLMRRQGSEDGYGGGRPRFGYRAEGALVPNASEQEADP
ncbi:MAG: hypothetical protein ACRDV8_02220 [Acidimicrobiales bacterium]